MQAEEGTGDGGACHLLHLPDMVMRQILLYMSYENISELRLVCRHFDRLCQELLSQGCRQVIRYHALCFKRLKSKLPKRESERRAHPLARRCDILSAVETRLSLLSMAYSKYMDLQLCCFIPGKVIDEAFAVLHHVQHAEILMPMTDLLRELRDISSMAIEHFEEEIVPTLKRTIQPPPNMPSIVRPGSTIFKMLNEMKAALKKQETLAAALSRKVGACAAHRKLIAEQGQRLAQQERTIAELRAKLAGQGQSLVGQERRLALMEERMNRYTFELLPELAGKSGGLKRKEATREEDGGSSGSSSSCSSSSASKKEDEEKAKEEEEGEEVQPLGRPILKKLRKTREPVS